eukprot:1367139-Pyramimonas_sp.AAC.1
MPGWAILQRCATRCYALSCVALLDHATLCDASGCYTVKLLAVLCCCDVDMLWYDGGARLCAA